VVLMISVVQSVIVC